jgi:hypothetical protein
MDELRQFHVVDQPQAEGGEADGVNRPEQVERVEPGGLDVLDAVHAERRDVPLAQEGQAGRAESGLRSDGRRLPDRAAGQGARDVPGVDQEHVTRLHGHPLALLSGGELVREDRLAWLQPLDPVQCGDVQQHAPADDAVARVMDRELLRAAD